MVRKAIVFFACAILLAGCGPGGGGLLRRAPNEMFTELAAAPPGGQQFSYSHAWNLVMPHAAVSPRFEAARAACLKDRTLNCKLLSANISLGDGPANAYDSATLDVLLPHGSLERFEAVLRGAPADEVTVISRTTRADSVEDTASGLDAKIARLTAYHERIAALAKRPNLSIDDMLKLEAELSAIQDNLDEAIAQKRDTGERIAREHLTVQMSEHIAATSPIAQTWAEATDTLTDNTASALRFLIAIIPWSPIIAGGIFLLSWLWRLFRRRQKVIVIPEKTPGA